MASDKNISFLLKDIHTVEFATFEECYDEAEKIDIDQEFGFGVNIDESSIAVKYSTVFNCNKKAFIKLEVVCEFTIEKDSFNSFQNKKSKAYKIPKGLLTHLSVITVGTARGVLHAKLEKTKFEHFILPTMDISDLLEDDLVVNPS